MFGRLAVVRKYGVSNAGLYQLGRVGQKRFHRAALPHKTEKQDGSSILSTMGFESYYNVRSNIQLLIQDMSKRELPSLNYAFLMKYRDKIHRPTQQYTMNIQYMNMLLAMTCQQLDLIQKMPYIVLLNPNIELTHSLYLKTLKSLLSCNYPYDLYDREKMSMLMKQFLNDHEDTLVTLSSGLQEVVNHGTHQGKGSFNRDSITQFLNKHLLIRIKMKLIATHYLKIMEQQSSSKNNNNDDIGILNGNVNISSLIRHNFEYITDMCHLQYDPILLPRLNIIKGEDIVVPMVPIILEYIMTEVLKNSTRTSIEQNMLTHSPSRSIDIRIYQESMENPDKIMIKISDQGGGIPPMIEPHILEYSYTTLNNSKQYTQTQDPLEEDSQEHKQQDAFEDINVAQSHNTYSNNNNIAGMGFGLPLCKLYLELFGGKLEIQNLYGHGTDTYLTLPLPQWPD